MLMHVPAPSIACHSGFGLAEIGALSDDGRAGFTPWLPVLIYSGSCQPSRQASFYHRSRQSKYIASISAWYRVCGLHLPVSQLFTAVALTPSMSPNSACVRPPALKRARRTMCLHVVVWSYIISTLRSRLAG